MIGEKKKRTTRLISYRAVATTQTFYSYTRKLCGPESVVLKGHFHGAWKTRVNQFREEGHADILRLSVQCTYTYIHTYARAHQRRI